MNDIIIVSIDIVFGRLNAHIIIQRPMGDTFTLYQTTIVNNKELETIRRYIEHNNKREIALFFKDKFSLEHCSITVSYGPEIRKLLKSAPTTEKLGKYTLNERKEKNYYESKNYFNRSKFSR